MLEKILRGIVILLFSVTGVVLANQGEMFIADFLPKSTITETVLGITILSLVIMVIGAIVGAVVGYMVSPRLIRYFFYVTERMEKSLAAVSTQDLLMGVAGLFLGLIIANLVGLAFGNVPYIGPYVSVVLSIILGYIGMNIAIDKKTEVTEWMKTRSTSSSKSKPNIKDGKKLKLLDTNIIIDGRIADIYQTGFLEGPIAVPVFVLEELQKIADSSDVLKRNRGRRGLDILNQIRKRNKDDFKIITDDFEDISEVDSKLIQLALKKGYKLITNDYNLNKVAELQGITVLNMNDLALAVKPAVIPGERVFVQIVRHGKEEGQGVAFLEDGTMIIVDQGATAIGHEVPVVIASVLQTSKGKMIFAKMEEPVE